MFVMYIYEVPMGSRSFKYFKKETIEKYAAEFGWEQFLKQKKQLRF